MFFLMTFLIPKGYSEVLPQVIIKPEEELALLRVLVAILILSLIILYVRVWVRNNYMEKILVVKKNLEKEKYLLDFLMDNLPVLIYFKDKDSKFIRFSKHLVEYFGLHTKDIVGKTDFDIQDTVHALEAFEDEQRMIRTGKAKINYVEKEIHLDGSEKWVSTTKMPLFDKRGNIVGTCGISKDVTDVRHQYEELVSREEKIKIQNLKLKEQQEELETQNETLIQSQEEISTQMEMAALQNAKIQEAGDTIAIQNEEIKRRNENLEAEVENRTKELVEYNQQLEQFAFISAHNLRAPVARILGLGHLLDLLPLETDLRERKLIYDKMVSTACELDRVVSDLNTILEIKKNNTSVVSEINLDQQLQLIKVNLEKEIEETKAEISVDFSNANTIYTVKPYLDSILINLISNAIKYRCPDRTPIICIRTELRDDYTCLIVQDNGLGIDLALHKEKIFTLYNRFHTHVEGKGLGLYLVKTQVTALGGKIEVESEVDRGITFYVYLRTHAFYNFSS
jgi:PAS domain S-box-containing protein